MDTAAHTVQIRRLPPQYQAEVCCSLQPAILPLLMAKQIHMSAQCCLKLYEHGCEMRVGPDVRLAAVWHVVCHTVEARPLDCAEIYFALPHINTPPEAFNKSNSLSYLSKLEPLTGQPVSINAIHGAHVMCILEAPRL